MCGGGDDVEIGDRGVDLSSSNESSDVRDVGECIGTYFIGDFLESFPV